MESTTGIDIHPLLTAEPDHIVKIIGPNPFRNSVRMLFHKSIAAPITITIFNSIGRRVAALPAGAHTIAWNGLNSRGEAVPNGTYFVRCEAGGLTASRTVIKNDCLQY